MALIEASLVSILTNNVTVAAVTTTFSPLILAQPTDLPAIVYTRINTIPETANATTSTLMGSRIRFDCYAKTIIAAKELAQKVKGCLDGYIGTILGNAIDGIIYLDEYDSFDTDAELPVVGVDFRVWHRL